ncbi:MAG: hypothetical protein KF718_02135 [Polyangiaceae bacterium]|nr:hypothetical protein [Polyangiaceae bacterium]
MNRALIPATLTALLCSSSLAQAAPSLQVIRAPGSALPARDALLSRVQPALRASVVQQPSTALAGGRKLLRFTQQRDGLPVLGRGVRGLVGANGRLTIGATRLVEQFDDSLASVTPRQAAERAERAAGVRFDASRSFPAWLPVGSRARRVFVHYRPVVNNVPYAPLVLIDAVTGSVLINVNAVSFDRMATVHLQNPVVTPVPEPVFFESLAPGATTLANDAFVVHNCIDQGSLSQGQFKFRVCDLEPRAEADANGDFPHLFEGDTEAEDSYAEVAAFHHLSRAQLYLEALGLPSLSGGPVTAVVNLRMATGFASGDYGLMQNTSLPLEPYNNAFFAPQSPFGKAWGSPGLGLWFGQGQVTDFAYDGDVVMHELGHAVVNDTAGLVPYWHLDAHGALPSPGAMNEGLADYLSSAVTGDPNVGEYAGKNIGASSGEAKIRTLDNEDACPGSISGEVHIDSTLFSGALWKTRQSLPEADRMPFDAAVLDAMMLAPTGDLGFDEFSELLLAAVSASPLGPGVEASLQAELLARGVLPQCPRVRDYQGPVYGHSETYGFILTAPGRDIVPSHVLAPYVPGVLQVKYELKPGATLLNVSWEDVPRPSNSGGQSTPYNPALLVRFADTPIEFVHGAGETSNVPEVTPVTKLAGSYRAEVSVPDDATTAFVMIVNRGERDGFYRGLTLTTKSSAPPPSFGGTGGTGGAFGGTGGTSSASDPGLTPRGGCALAAADPTHSRVPGAWFTVALLLAGLRRASRARTFSRCDARRDSRGSGC